MDIPLTVDWVDEILNTKSIRKVWDFCYRTTISRDGKSIRLRFKSGEVFLITISRVLPPIEPEPVKPVETNEQKFLKLEKAVKKSQAAIKALQKSAHK